jgi:glutaredoxin
LTTVFTIDGPCPRCKTLRNWLDQTQVSYETKLIDSEAIAEFRINGVFSLEAPVLQVASYWYAADELFQKDGSLDKDKLRKIFYLS